MRITPSARDLPSLLDKALASTPRSEWTTSNRVAYAYLNCPRLKKMIASIENKMKPQALAGTADDLYQNIWIMIGPRIADLDKPENIYTWLYAWFQNHIRTTFNSTKKEMKVDNLTTPESVDDNSETLLDKMAISSGIMPDEAQIIEEKLDLEAGTRKFREKLARCGWPSHIPHDSDAYRRIGRPRKDK